jgi:hypothetical protein
MCECSTCRASTAYFPEDRVNLKHNIWIWHMEQLACTALPVKIVIHLYLQEQVYKTVSIRNMFWIWPSYFPTEFYYPLNQQGAYSWFIYTLLFNNLLHISSVTPFFRDTVWLYYLLKLEYMVAHHYEVSSVKQAQLVDV